MRILEKWCRLKPVVCVQRAWIFPTLEADLISSIPLSSCPCQDTLNGTIMQMVIILVKSAYQLLKQWEETENQNPGTSTQNLHWYWIWNVHCPPWIKLLFGEPCKKEIPTKMVLHQRIRAFYTAKSELKKRLFICSKIVNLLKYSGLLSI